MPQKKKKVLKTFRGLRACFKCAFLTEDCKSCQNGRGAIFSSEEELKKWERQHGDYPGCDDFIERNNNHVGHGRI